MLSCYPSYHDIVLFSVYSYHDAFAYFHAESHWTYQTYVWSSLFRLFSSVPPSQVHREKMLPLSSVFFPCSKIVDVLLWTLSSTAVAGSYFIGEYHCYFYASFILGSFESRQKFYVLLLSMIETIVVKAWLNHIVYKMTLFSAALFVCLVIYLHLLPKTLHRS